MANRDLLDPQAKGHCARCEFPPETLLENADAPRENGAEA